MNERAKNQLLGGSALVGAGCSMVAFGCLLPFAVIFVVIAAVAFGIDPTFALIAAGVVFVVVLASSLSWFFDVGRKPPERAPTPVNPPSPQMYRECPHCKEQMRRDASVCPHCQRDSEPWRKEGDRWWQLQEGTWRHWDEGAHQWREPSMNVAVDLRDLTTDEAATFAIFAASAEKTTDEELAALLVRLPDHAWIQRRAIVAEQARRREPLSAQADTSEPDEVSRE